MGVEDDDLERTPPDSNRPGEHYHGNNNDNRNGSNSLEHDTNLVDWDGPDDPYNPQNFSRRRKWLITINMGLMAFCATFASSVFSSATVATSKQFGISQEVMTLGTSLFVLVRALVRDQKA